MSNRPLSTFALGPRRRIRAADLEARAIRLMEKGKDAREIGEQLQVSPHTVITWLAKERNRIEQQRQAKERPKNVTPRAYRTGFRWGAGL